MSFHADVFLMKENSIIKKKTYFTTSYRCDQDTKDSLSIADYVLKQFSKAFPSVNELFGKCDNAGCYHGNPYPELLYHISKQNEFFLKRSDYNELQKGKDQCDRDSALTRNVLRTYVEEGSYIMNAGDIVNALSEVSIKNTSISEVEFDNTISVVQGNDVPKISTLHFIKKGKRP